jgi:PAS domain S-box-containing protein
VTFLPLCSPVGIGSDDGIVEVPSGKPMSMLDQTAERLSLALAAARMGDYRWDAKTDIVTFSTRAAELAGTTPGETLSLQAVRELVHPDDRHAVSVAINRAIAERGEYSVEHRVTKVGRDRAVRASGRAIFDERGDLVGIVGVLQDVTTDRFLLQVDDAVRPLIEAEQVTYTAAAMLGEYLSVERCAYCFVEADQDTFNLTGNYTRGVASIVGTYRFRQFGAECLRLMRAGEPYVVSDSRADARIDDEDREAYEATGVVGVVCVPILKSGRFVAAMAVHTAAPRRWRSDEVELVQLVASRCGESIERVRVERERQGLLDAAQSANRTKDEFLAMLGHELRNPLAPIKTALQLMQMKDELAFERERTVIERQTAHLTRLVDDLLDVARIARGMVELRAERVELSEIVTRALEVAGPLAAQRSHTVDVHVASTGLLLDGDPGRLTQVVANLLTNAAKYTPPGGKITITGSQRDSDIVLSVRDNGIGMTAETLEHAFERFVQGRQGVDRAQGGLGLGLSIVQSLVQRHGGSVEARSDGPGGGSELIVRLPSAQAERVSPLPRRASELPPRSWQRKRVLVVDDNQDAAALLAEALALRGCQVQVAYDAARALQLASLQPFDFALLDIGLPVMDGYELASRLRQLAHLADAALIAVTGYGQDSDRRRAQAAGFHHHLVKPVDLRALDQIVAQRN